MTLKQVIDMVDNIKPNAFDVNTKTQWINEVEGFIQTEVFLLSVNEIERYMYSGAYNGAGIAFPDSKTMVFPEPTGFTVGGAIKISGLTTYSGNNSQTPRKILSVYDRGTRLVFADNTFQSTGDTGDAGEATVDFDGSGSVLLVEPPHEKLYWVYLCAMIDFANGEYNKYENTMQLYNTFAGEFMRWFANVYHPADRR